MSSTSCATSQTPHHSSIPLLKNPSPGRDKKTLRFVAQLLDGDRAALKTPPELSNAMESLRGSSQLASDLLYVRDAIVPMMAPWAQAAEKRTGVVASFLLALAVARGEYQLGFTTTLRLANPLGVISTKRCHLINTHGCKANSMFSRHCFRCRPHEAFEHAARRLKRDLRAAFPMLVEWRDLAARGLAPRRPSEINSVLEEMVVIYDACNLRRYDDPSKLKYSTNGRLEAMVTCCREGLPPHVTSFLSTVGLAARRAQSRHGIPASYLIAETALSSDWGRRRNGCKHRYYRGPGRAKSLIKFPCNGEDLAKAMGLRCHRFRSVEAAFMDHAARIRKKIKGSAADVGGLLQKLEESGWNSDGITPILTRLIAVYQLQAYDGPLPVFVQRRKNSRGYDQAKSVAQSAS